MNKTFVMLLDMFVSSGNTYLNGLCRTIRKLVRCITGTIIGNGYLRNLASVILPYQKGNYLVEKYHLGNCEINYSPLPKRNV